MGWGGETFAVGAQAVRPISAIAGPTFYLSAAQVGLSQSKEHQKCAGSVDYACDEREQSTSLAPWPSRSAPLIKSQQRVWNKRVVASCLQTGSNRTPASAGHEP